MVVHYEFGWTTGLLPIRSWKLLKECLLISCMLSFRAMAKSASAHRWPHLSSHCYSNTHRHSQRDKHVHAYWIYKGLHSELVILVQTWHWFLCGEILQVVRLFLCSCLTWLWPHSNDLLCLLPSADFLFWSESRFFPMVSRSLLSNTSVCLQAQKKLMDRKCSVEEGNGVWNSLLDTACILIMMEKYYCVKFLVVIFSFPK